MLWFNATKLYFTTGLRFKQNTREKVNEFSFCSVNFRIRSRCISDTVQIKCHPVTIFIRSRVGIDERISYIRDNDSIGIVGLTSLQIRERELFGIEKRWTLYSETAELGHVRPSRRTASPLIGSLPPRSSLWIIEKRTSAELLPICLDCYYPRRREVPHYCDEDRYI